MCMQMTFLLVLAGPLGQRSSKEVGPAAVRKLTGHLGAVITVAYSPDGKLIASGGADRVVILWDAVTGRKVGVLAGHRGTVISLAYSRDGKKLASASSDGKIIVWDVHTRKRMRTLTGHNPYVLRIDMSPSGTKLVSSRLTDSGNRTKDRVTVWDIASGEVTQELKGGAKGGLAFCWGRKDEFIAVGSGDGTATLWDLLRARPSSVITRYKDAVLDVDLNRNETLLASASADGTFRVLALDKGSELLKASPFNMSPLAPSC